MPYTAQKPADAGKLIALYLREVIFVSSWGILGGALLLPFTLYWYYGIPAAVLIAVYFLASMETTDRTGPLVALELRQYSPEGRRNVPNGLAYLRIILTVILFPPLLLSCVTILFGKRSLPELFTGIRITEIDRRLDPRPGREIEQRMTSARSRLRSLIIAPLAVSALMFFLRHSAPEVVSIQGMEADETLPEHEQELLVHYLELTTLHPEELEYHVRLASLYYRNDMQQDLIDELEVIRELDPEHAILILADTTAFSFSMLEPNQGTDSLPPDTTITLTVPEPQTQADTTEADEPDTLPPVEPELLEGTPESTPDSLVVEVTPDTLETVTDDSASVETTPLEEGDTTETPDVSQTPEEAIEPDTLVHP